MNIIYIFEYFLFTFLASFAVLQLAIAKNLASRKVLGVVVLISSYVWFFTVRNRNIQTMVEGLQLFALFGLGALLAVFITKAINRLILK